MICSLIQIVSIVDIQDTMIKALVFAAALNVCAGSPDLDETEALKSLNEVKNLEIFGNFITIIPKNTTEPKTNGSDAFEEYLHSHVIRIKAPFSANNYLNYELGNLVPDDMAEGRKKKRMNLRDILVPLLLAIKYKASVLTVLMLFVTVVAFKGLWVGMAGLFLSKLVAVKVFLQPQNKSDDDHEENEDNDQHSDHHETSSHNADEEEHEDREEPIVIYLNSNRRSGKLSRRRQGPFLVRQYYDPKSWNPWRRQQIFENAK